MSKTLSSDCKWMQHALQLAEKGRLTAPPNPWVGCVITKNEQLIGEGYHQTPGMPHAEVEAIANATESIKGATLYSTLEPCAHEGRTPSCAKAIVKTGISRIVVGVVDPDSNVSGRGIQILRDAGIDVIVGIEEKNIQFSLRSYLHHRKTNKPYCVLKSALSVDGKAAAQDGTSQWITEPLARKDVHLLRAQSQAVVVGSETALVDDPKLNVRLDHLPDNYPPPLRVLLDRRGRVLPQGHLADLTLAPTLVVTCSEEHASRWKQIHADVILLPSSNNIIRFLLEELGKRSILQVLVEGGPTLHTAFLNQRHANELHLYLGGKLLGGKGNSAFPSLHIPTLDSNISLNLLDCQSIGKDLRLQYSIEN